MGRFFEGYQELGFFTPGRFLYSVDGEATPGRPLLTLSTQASFTTGDPASAASPLRSMLLLALYKPVIFFRLFRMSMKI